MSVESPPVWIQAGGETAERARRATASFLPLNDEGYRGGIVDPDDLVVTESGTPAMSVDIAAGACFVPGSEDTYQGTYFVENRGSVTLTIAAADPTNDRIDVIVARVKDSAYSGSDDLAELAVVTGTAAASPAEPDRGDNAWVLAVIDVGAGVTSITDADIADRRTTQTHQKAAAFSERAPRGVLAYDSTTTANTGIDANGVSVLTATVTIPGQGDRYIRVSGMASYIASTSPMRIFTDLLADSTRMVSHCIETQHNTGGSVFGTGLAEATGVFTGGDSVTFALKPHPATGTLNTVPSSDNPVWLLVEDIGPA